MGKDATAQQVGVTRVRSIMGRGRQALVSQYPVPGARQTPEDLAREQRREALHRMNTERKRQARKRRQGAAKLSRRKNRQ